MIPLPISNLIAQAKRTATRKSSPTTAITATFITPKGHYPAIGVEYLGLYANFQKARADVGTVFLRIQPGVYQDRILPYKDNLIVEIVERIGINAVSKRWQATPTQDPNQRISGNSSKLVNMAAADNTSFITVKLSLLEISFDAMRNMGVSQSFVSAKPDQVLHNLLTTSCQQIGLQGVDAFKGVDIESPIDNTQIYRQIMIKQGTRLTDVAHYLQHEEGIGIYTRGIGAFYRRGMWYVYPLTKAGRYGVIKNALDIIRIPEDIVPSLDETFYASDKSVTLISTGPAEYEDGTDILHQNLGTGKQLISPSAVSGVTGVHYANGRAIKTRQDSLTEYQTRKRGSGKELIELDATPTANPFPNISATALRDMSIVRVEWHNSDHFLIYPGAPVKYYYMEDGNVLKTREGTAIAVNTEYHPVNAGVSLQFKKNSKIEIFLLPETQS